MTFQQQFENKVIAITGAASGIALATAHLLAQRGAKLSIADVSKDALEKAAAEIKDKYQTDVISRVVDVRDYTKVDEWIRETKTHFGKLDGAANLAGVIPPSFSKQGIDSQDMDEWDFVLDINLKGVLHCMKSQLQNIEDGGAIVNAASVAGLVGRPKNAAYTASKHGVVGLTRSAAKEVGVRNIRVNSIAPGRIETPMVQTADRIAGLKAQETGAMMQLSTVPLGRGGLPEEVAKLVAFLLSSEASYISGATIPIDGGWNC